MAKDTKPTKDPLQGLEFEKKNKDMIKLPKYARVQKRPIPHAPIASPYAGSSVPKTVYVSTKSPFMSSVKRVQKLLRQAEKRATASVLHPSKNSRQRDQQRLAQLARAGEQLSREEVFVKATGRAMEKALSVGRWFEERSDEYVVRVKTGNVLVVDDVVEDEEEKKKVLEEAEKLRAELHAQPDADADADGKKISKSATKKRKRAANAAASIDDSELPETRTRWVNMVEIAVALK
ncbi:hypothetical protein EYZ11_004741 [Aspergillus tanneri]|uniref:Uncharacterized protein n=1 Tax=Aspergillus tanneri TaxID=1220188 RepID=A0A4S3JM44_9EURO|nr:uncharacterized protein ATNIH1004_005928 [Aspergillus tanneri]KAA8647238.1 hypothetical protein ATNIH1004_005928 [Aspergillus tanneri]THC95788.1 hypothetical protein EYZ11_004741 [Aspergillus tanneri]